MKKVKLNLDDLKVESFVTTPDATSGRGTVFGQVTHPWDSCGGTCVATDPCGTCSPANTCIPGACTDAGLTCPAPACPPESEQGTCAPAETCYTCVGQGTCPDPTCGYTCTAFDTNCPPCEPYPTWTDAGCTLCGQIC